ncbi:MAG: 2-oxo acid dehydrogenase subunit E2 [Hyphomicrobiaceae bacterium]
MKHSVKMPALSDTMERGRLLRWLKQPGAAVARGEAIAEVETDKAVMEMEAFHSGTLIGPLVAEDREYPVGETLAWIGDEAAAEAGATPAKTGEKTEGRGAAGKGAAAAAPETTATDVTPAAQQQAAGGTRGTRPQPEAPSAEEAADQGAAAESPGQREEPRPPQRAASAVVEQALAGRAPPRTPEGSDASVALLREIASGPPYRIEPQRQLRRVIATTLARAVQTPQFRISTRLDLSAFKSAAEANDASFTLRLARACALTVKDLPEFNAAWTPDGLARRERVDVAIAMEAEHGLLTPVLRDVAGRTLAELAQDWRAIKQKIRDHRMTPQDFRGATFYLSNLGMFPGVVQFDAIVPPGAAAILAVAAPDQAGTMLTLSCDHRVIFGAEAARFLAALAERLARPLAGATDLGD